MNDYNNMSLIYEALAKDTTRSYSPDEAGINHTLGRKLPFNGVKSGGAYDAGQGGQGVTSIISDEETAPAWAMKADILKEIERLMTDAESFEDVKTMIALKELETFVTRMKT